LIFFFVVFCRDGSHDEVVIAGDRLKNYEELIERGKQYEYCQATVGEASERLIDRIYRLDEGGATALGPALAFAMGLAAGAPGSKIALFTDGLANIGVGSLEEKDEFSVNAATTFYDQMAATAKANQTMVSVVSIRGSEAGLDTLGKLVATTSGSVDICDPLKLATALEGEAFWNKNIVATNVHVTFVIDKHFKWSDQQSFIVNSAASASAATVNNSAKPLQQFKLSHDLGIITDTADLTASFAPIEFFTSTQPLVLQAQVRGYFCSLL